MADNLPDNVKNQMKQLKQWIDSQPHFPKNVDDKLILRFLHSCYYNFDKAKTTAELFFSLRASAPEILSNRDPQSPAMQKTLKIVNLAQYQITGKKNVWVWQLNDPGLEHYDYLLDAKLFFLMTDAWLLDNTDLEEEDIVILDVKDLTLKFVTKFNVSIAKKLSKYQEDALPIRLKAVHIVNAPPIIDKLFALMKPFMKQDMTNMIHFHTPKSTTLYKYLSKEELPADFGGNLPPLEEYNKESHELLNRRRECFLQDNLWCSEKKSKNKSSPAIEIDSFRSLAID